jgi:hypothetical protein
MKQIYEILNECKLAKSSDELINILRQNDSMTLRKVFYFAYHPNAAWYISEFPNNYKKQDTLPGISMTNLFTELRRIYLFQKGHPEADKLSDSKRHDLLLHILEGMELDEAKVFIDIMKGDLGIKDITVGIISTAYPDLFK